MTTVPPAVSQSITPFIGGGGVSICALTEIAMTTRTPRTSKTPNVRPCFILIGWPPWPIATRSSAGLLALDGTQAAGCLEPLVEDARLVATLLVANFEDIGMGVDEQRQRAEAIGARVERRVAGAAGADRAQQRPSRVILRRLVEGRLEQRFDA